MRVSDLDLEVMVRLCQQLRIQVPAAQVYVLAESPRAPLPAGLTVTSTKLVELRNPLADNTLRPPLLVFIPSDLRAAAEDSFGVATFEEVALSEVYGELGKLLLAEVPNGLRPTIAEVLRRIAAAQWPFADAVAVARYLLTVKLNDYDRDAAGAALFELGLVPDFELLTDLARASLRVSHNLEKVRTLTWSGKSERGRVVELGLSERAFRTQLANFLVEVGLEEPRLWTRRIVAERENWQFSFHRWKFDKDEEPPGAICIEVVETSLPQVGDAEDDERLSRLVGQHYLPVGKKGMKQFSVTFRAAPHPASVQGLVRFSAQVVSQEGGLVGLVKNVAAWKSTKDRATVTFTKLGTVDWEEGWHFVRIQPLTADGDLIPLLNARGEPLSPLESDDDIRRPNESDLFYVVPEGEIDVPPLQRTVPRDDSLSHAWKRLQFAALLDQRNPADVMPQEVRWLERTERGRISGIAFIEARFGRDGVIHIPISQQLKVLEQKILMSPGGSVSWRLPIRLGQAGESVSDAAGWPEDPSTQTFLAARAHYFTALRAAGKELVTQAADLRQLRSLIVAYAEAYQALVAHLLQRAESAVDVDSQHILFQLRHVLALDTIALDILNHKGERREAALIAPTHPLRALWLATWAEVAEAWLHQAATGAPEHVIPAREALLKTLAPLSFPPVLPRGTGQLFTAVDNVTPFWTLYAPTNEEDPRGLVGDVCAALGLPEPGIGGATITGAYLASRVERYLIQHPYVQTLVINAFNAGRASVLADMLLALQGRPAFADLRYDLRLFVPDSDAPGVGETLSELLSPSSSVTGKEADAFSAMGENHLYPKLGLAIRSIAEFAENPQRHMAHLTFLFDLFPAKEISATRGEEPVCAAPVHGLFQDFCVDYTEDEHTVAWQRRPQHGLALELPEAEELTDLLTSLPLLLSSAVASVATGQTGLKRVPVITLTLEAQDRALIHHVHEVSDWVITVDRNMGIEFFDHGGKPGRPDYLIDHSPDMTSDFGHRLFITSRLLQELQMMLEPALIQYGLPADQEHATVLLYQIRSLAGRLALKLISSPTQRAEVLGLALARLYLDYQGVLKNHILVPLDAHLELYHVVKSYAEELQDEVSFKRTDLALFDLETATRTITCRLVEVKCYSGVGDLSAYNQLKTRIAEQIAQSEQVLAHHFDPYRTPQDRPDRLIKTREFVTLLAFYLDRSVRYQLFDTDAADEARALLATLERGYQLQFTRSALIFDFEKPGTEPAVHEGGIEYHRMGKDLIYQLIEAAKAIIHMGESEVITRVSGEGEQTRTLSAQELSIPRLQTAAFLGVPRVRHIQSHVVALEGNADSYVPSEPPDSDAAETRQASLEHARTFPEEERERGTIPHIQRNAVGILSEVPQDSAESPGSTDARHTIQATEVQHDILLGTTKMSPQYGILGEASGRKVALDLNETHTISLFGVQGGGKSYTLGTIAEMAVLTLPHINVLPRPLATIIFHYSPTQEYQPEFTSMVAPNDDAGQLHVLREQYGAGPQALRDLILLAPEDKLTARRTEYPNIEIRPLKFAAAELQASHWRFLMGAVGSQSTYIRQLNYIMREHRRDLSLAAIRQGIDNSRLPEHLKDLAHQRLDLAAAYIDDTAHLGDVIRPGRLVIVDLRDEFIEKDEALGLFVVLLQLFADVRYNGESFNKLVVFDEAHKYIGSPDLVASLIEVVREMRHKGTSIMVASQDPPSVPVSLIELSSQIILHQFNSPAWLKHIQKANAALAALTPEKMAHLSAGEAYTWSSKATDEVFSKGVMKIRCRPRVTRHGGGTKTAVPHE
jgi:hypothetical protein